MVRLSCTEMHSEADFSLSVWWYSPRVRLTGHIMGQAYDLVNCETVAIERASHCISPFCQLMAEQL